MERDVYVIKFLQSVELSGKGQYMKSTSYTVSFLYNTCEIKINYSDSIVFYYL